MKKEKVTKDFDFMGYKFKCESLDIEDIVLQSFVPYSEKLTKTKLLKSLFGVDIAELRYLGIKSSIDDVYVTAYECWYNEEWDYTAEIYRTTLEFKLKDILEKLDI